MLTYVLMWACFFTVAFAIPARSAAGQFLLLLGAFAPGIVRSAFPPERVERETSKRCCGQFSDGG